MTLAFFGSFGHQDSDARTKRNHFSSEPSSTRLMFSIETLLKEVPHVVRERDEFEYQNKSIISALFGIFV